LTFAVSNLSTITPLTQIESSIFFAIISRLPPPKDIEIVGNRFASSEYFVPDLVCSGEILKTVTKLVKPKVSKAAESKRLGKVVFGTVAGDIHDIGKDVIAFMLDVNGFKVWDNSERLN